MEQDWRICPACEHPLKSFVCPGCAKPMKEHWARCPFCESRLLCATCKRRLASADGVCPACNPAEPEKNGRLPEAIREPVAGMEFVLVPEGSFLMGDLFDDGIENEKPIHEVRLDSFYIGLYPVTQAQWTALMPENPSLFQGERHPVERVAFHDAEGYINRLAEANQGRYIFGLPTEAQWEYAARSGGKKEKYAGGDFPEKLAWYDENGDGTSQPVGKKSPNGLGIYDMCGNVWEWCLDFYDENAYKFHDDLNPVREKKGPDRVVRGGGWNMDAWSARCSRRFGFRSQDFGPALGFRLVLRPNR